MTGPDGVPLGQRLLVERRVDRLVGVQWVTHVHDDVDDLREWCGIEQSRFRCVDRLRQEDARTIAFAPGASFSVEGDGKAEGAFVVSYALADRPTGPVTVTVGDTRLDVTSYFSVSGGKEWREMVLTDACIDESANALTISSQQPLVLSISAINRTQLPDGTECSF